MKKYWFGLPLFLLFFFCPQSEGKVSQKEVDEAVQKGVQYLLSEQEVDGSWKGTYGTSYPMGTTALTLLTLLKCDISPNHPAIVRGFKKLDQMQCQRVYSVALYIMALEARYTPSKKVLEKYEKKYSRGTIIRKAFEQKASPQDRKRLDHLVNWLLRRRAKKAWRYPEGGEDVSNTQYVMLALSSAERMGVFIPQDYYEKVAEYFLEGQQADGPTVNPFPVPAAEEPIHDLLRKKQEKKLDELPTFHRTAERQKQAYGKSKESLTMKARGWSYVTEGKGPERDPTGSMTTAGIAAMVICKARLETLKDKNSQALVMKINQSIRDGCAWLSHNFSVTNNPPRGGWHYYYLYGLERAGALSSLEKFGTHDWYEEGASHLLKNQKSDGTFGNDGMGPLVNTSFAILFLKKATVPVREKPERIVTGSGKH